MYQLTLTSKQALFKLSLSLGNAEETRQPFSNGHILPINKIINNNLKS